MAMNDGVMVAVARLWWWRWRWQGLEDDGVKARVWVRRIMLAFASDLRIKMM